jgi:predicted outer membrane protein
MLATPFIAMLLFVSPQTPGPSTRPSTEDQIFVTKAAKDGQAEVELATLAQKKATSEQAKTLAASFAPITSARTPS